MIRINLRAALLSQMYIFDQVTPKIKPISNNGNYDGEVVFSKLQELIIVCLLLMIILFLFFGQSLLPSRVLSAADGTLSTPFFAEVTPQEFIPPSNALLFDQVYQFVPWRHFAWEALRQGYLPLWNPYSSAGTPFVATMQSAIFYPINLLLTFIPFASTLVWSAFLRLWIAGICTYLLTRYYGLGLVASLIPAISFMLSGFLIVWLGHPNTNVAIWLPALILLAEILLRATRKSKILLAVALLALIIGIQFTGGHIETSVDILLAFGLYYLFRWTSIFLPQKYPLVVKLRHLVILPGIAVVLGTGMAAVQLAPFLEWLPLSNEFYHRGGLGFSFEFINSGFWRKLLELPVILFPNLYNNPTWNEYLYWSFLPGGNYNENILYIGTTTLVFALIAIFTASKNESLIKVWIIIGIISFGKAFYLPVFDWLNQLPLLDLGRPDRFRLIFSFTLCILAGFGVHAFGNSSFSRPKRVEKVWLWSSITITVIGLIILITGNTLLPAIKDQITAYGREQVVMKLANRTIPPQHPIEYYYAQVDEMVTGLLAVFRSDNLAMYTPIFWALLGLIFLIWSRRYGSQKIERLKIVLIVLVTIDLISFGRNYNPSIPVDYFYPSTSVVQQLVRDKTLFRFTVLHQDLVPDAHMMFDLQDVRGLDFPTYWYDQYMDLVSDRISWLNYGTIYGSVDSPLLQILNIKYIASSKPDMLETNENIRILDKKGNIYLGEMVNTTPRAFIVYQAVLTNNDEEAAQILNKEPESIFQRVILSDAESAPSPTAPLFSSEKNIVSNVFPMEYEANHSTWQVNTSENGYLFLSDAYYPGWKANLDNQPTELYRANIAFRAVYVPKGEHIVSFHYEPTSIFIGATISILSTVIILSILILAYRHTLKSETPENQNSGVKQ